MRLRSRDAHMRVRRWTNVRVPELCIRFPYEVLRAGVGGGVVTGVGQAAEVTYLSFLISGDEGHCIARQYPLVMRAVRDVLTGVPAGSPLADYSDVDVGMAMLARTQWQLSTEGTPGMPFACSVCACSAIWLLPPPKVQLAPRVVE